MTYSVLVKKVDSAFYEADSNLTIAHQCYKYGIMTNSRFH